MPLAKLTCPKCQAVLKPAKPVPEGKAVKCPKCAQTFKAGEEPAEAKAAKKPAAASAAAADDDDDGGATYAVVKDEAEERKRAEAEERERKRRKRRRKAAAEGRIADEEEDDPEDNSIAAELLRNLKTRDPRGAAQEVLVRPANLLLITALIGFFGWVIYFIVFMIPVAFPVIPEGTDEYSQFKEAPDRNSKEKKKKEVPKDKYRHWWSAETILHEDNTPWSVVLFISVLLIGLVQAGVLGIASVRMQSLESYRWSMTGCIVAMIPLTLFPLFVFITSALDLLDSGLEMGMEDTTYFMAMVCFLWAPLVGAYCLKQLLLPQVKPGFEFKPD
jgi:hypothetical protein